MVTVPDVEVTAPDPNVTPALISVIVPVGPGGTDAVIEMVWP
jgi:hypothetical protein